MVMPQSLFPPILSWILNSESLIQIIILNLSLNSSFPFSHLCSDLNTQREESDYNCDDYIMIIIKKFDCFQPIDQQENIFPFIFQQEQAEFVFEAEI